MTKPISPEEVVTYKKKAIPDLVFEAFNYLIAENWDGRSSSFTLDSAVNKIIEEMDKNSSYDTWSVETRRKEIYKKHWLDVEDIYKEAGWRVEYDQPGYCETYKATYTFRKK